MIENISTEGQLNSSKQLESINSGSSLPDDINSALLTILMEAQRKAEELEADEVCNIDFHDNSSLVLNNVFKLFIKEIFYISDRMVKDKSLQS